MTTIDLFTHDVWLCPGTNDDPTLCKQMLTPHLHTDPTVSGPAVTLTPLVTEIQQYDQLIAIANARVMHSEPFSDYWWSLHVSLGDDIITFVVPNELRMTVLRPATRLQAPTPSAPRTGPAESHGDQPE